MPLLKFESEELPLFALTLLGVGANLLTYPCTSSSKLTLRLDKLSETPCLQMPCGIGGKVPDGPAPVWGSDGLVCDAGDE